jgi:hypothetical protein
MKERAMSDKTEQGMRTGGDYFPLTVGQIRDAIKGVSDDTEITFGSTLAGKELLFYRFKRRGEKLLQIELNEAGFGD